MQDDRPHKRVLLPPGEGLEFGHLVSVAAERRNNDSHGRKPVDGNFDDFPAPREMPIENHGLTPVDKVVSPLRG